MSRSDWWNEPPPLEILFLEDNPLYDTAAFRLALGQCEQKTKLTDLTDGDQGMDYVLNLGEYKNARRPDIIVTSLLMPRIRGQEFLEWIKKQPQLVTIPVIVLTTSEREEDILYAYDAGAAGFFTKPTLKEDYIPLVQAIVNYWTTARIVR